MNYPKPGLTSPDRSDRQAETIHLQPTAVTYGATLGVVLLVDHLLMEPPGIPGALRSVCEGAGRWQDVSGAAARENNLEIGKVGGSHATGQLFC